MLNDIISDLKSLEGKLVGKDTDFEKIYTNKAPINMISTIDVLENLKPYEIKDCGDIDEDDFIEEFIDELNLYGYEYEEIEANNTCNFNAPLTNHIEYSIYESNLDGSAIVELYVHRYGDIDENYTKKCYLKFECVCDFYDALDEATKELLVVGDKTYYVYIQPLNPCSCIRIDYYSTEEDEDEYEYENDIVFDSEAYELFEELLYLGYEVVVL